VARQENPELAAVLEKFICVRIVHGWGLDLSLFQFDTDMTLAVFFMNADRTIYGRYGTKFARDTSLEGLLYTAGAALEVHKGFPQNKPQVAAKTGPAPRWKTPEIMPTLKTRHEAGDVSSYGCIHCHTVHEGELTSRWLSGESIPDRLIWKYPLPNVVGLGLEAKDGRTVRTVGNNSAAQAAGIKPGDRVLNVAGQQILSVADVSWALQQAPDDGMLELEIERGAARERVTLALKNGWRRRISVARNNTTSMLQKTVSGFFCNVLSSGDKQKLGLPETALGLRVTYLPAAKEKDPNMNAVNAGIKVNDLIVEVDGQRVAMNADDWLAYLLQKKKPGQTLELTILRAGAEQKLNIPLPK